jgi:hypothetical protein
MLQYSTSKKKQSKGEKEARRMERSEAGSLEWQWHG